MSLFIMLNEHISIVTFSQDIKGKFYVSSHTYSSEVTNLISLDIEKKRCGGTDLF